MAGCNTIWIVANDDLAPIVRKIVGEWVYDPVYYILMSKFKLGTTERNTYLLCTDSSKRSRSSRFLWVVGFIWSIFGLESSIQDIAMGIPPINIMYRFQWPLMIYIESVIIGN